MNHNVERPIETEGDDRLLRQDFVARLLGALIEPEGRATGIVLGLSGPGGSGKSSILNMVAEMAEARHPAAIVVSFSPWQASSRSGLIHAFFAEVTAALEASANRPGCTQPEKLKGLAQTIFKYGKRVAPADGVWFCDGGAAAAGLDTLRQSLPGADTLLRMRAEVARELDQSGIDVVVLIDEIDRLDDRDVTVCAQLVRAVADFERFSYLLAYDADRFAPALGKGDIERGRACLEKIVQLQVPLPAVLPRQIRRIVDARFHELIDEPDEHRQRLNQLLGILVPAILGTVRDAKRALAGFELLYRLLRFEVDEVDLLGWSAIQAKYPEVEQVLRRRQEQIIGPGNRLFGEALLDRMLTGYRPAAVDVALKSEPDALDELWLEQGGDRLASGPAARPLQRLVEFLFKNPGEYSKDSLIALRAPVPLAKTLAFGTLVYAGDTGDTAPHPHYADVIREIGDQDAAALTRALQQADRSGNLAEYLVALHGCGHRVHPRLTDNVWPLDDIWSAFSDFAEPVPALTDPPRDGPNRMLAKFISGPYLHRLGEFRRFLKPNRDILREWIASGRFALAGHILEVQMKLELEQHDEPAPVTPFLAPKDVAPLCKELARACAAALHAGTLVESIADLACLRAILRGAPDAWDPGCRERLSETLARPELLDRFTWYCFGEFGEVDPDVAHLKAAVLVTDRDALRDRVVERLKSVDSLPEQIRRAIEPQVFDLLVYLVRNRDRVVSKDDLLAAVWSGRIVADADQPHPRVTPGSRRQRRHSAVDPHRAPQRPSLRPLPALSEKPSIVVLPFQNMSGHPEQEYFADGMVEAIITALSRIRWLFVIARNSSFTYKGRVVDVKQVGRDLNVRYVLEGSVRKAGQRIRISAQRIEAASEEHLWADRFDGSLEDVFELQGKVALSAAGVIEPTLQVAKTARVAKRPTDDLTAYDVYLGTYAMFFTSARQIPGALQLLEQAIERDPDNGPTLAWAAVCCVRLCMDGRSLDLEADSREGVDFARRSLQVAGGDPGVFANAALALAFFGEDIGAMMILVDRALSVHPSFARGWYVSACLRHWAGQPELAIEPAEASLRLSPRAQVGFYFTIIGAAHFLSRRFDKAIATLLLAIQEDPDYPPPYRFLASCYAHMGRLDEAREIVRRLRAITPLVAQSFSQIRNTDHRALILSGLRRAAAETE